MITNSDERCMKLHELARGLSIRELRENLIPEHHAILIINGGFFNCSEYLFDKYCTYIAACFN